VPDLWVDVGAEVDLRATPVREVHLGERVVALTCRDGIFGAISGTCLHIGGPLGQGTLEEDHVVCPWHQWKFHRLTGEAKFGNRVARYDVKIENGRVLIRCLATPPTRPT
jgi:nitrite reductase/ring-hydroxylating ferredoxin subunit